MKSKTEKKIETQSVLCPLISQAVAFTDAYRRHAREHVAVREAMCLKTQFPALLGDIQPDDALAGRLPRRRIAYFATIMWAAFPPEADGRRSEGKQGGYCFDFAAADKYAQTPGEKAVVAELARFWQSECGVSKVRECWDDEQRSCLLAKASAPVGGGYVVGGTSVGFCSAGDLDRLLRKGIPGLIAEIEARRAAVGTLGGDPGFLDGVRMAVDVLLDVCRHYEVQARGLAAAADDAGARARFDRMADALGAIQMRAPQSLQEAMQLAWLYTQLTCTNHPELWRLDVALGDFYARDVDAGVLTEAAALDLVLGLWRLVRQNGDDAVCRIVIGGRGRRNEAQADRFALAAMEATRQFRQVTPQLTLRLHRDQNPALRRKAFAVIGETGVYPMLYNDDAVIPGVAASLGVSAAEAERYHPLGCGEYMLAGCSPSQLDCVWSIPKSLEAALHDGCAWTGARLGPATGALDTFDTFEKLYAAFLAQARFAADLSARTYGSIFRAFPESCAFLFASLLNDDCLARGRALFDGGVRYKGACVMGHGFTNAADALTAIRLRVYGEKRLTLAEVVAALDANFEGHAAVRKLLQEATKFGNDDDAADRMLVDMWRDINAAAKEAGERAGLDFYIVSSVNPGGFGMGAQCGATADGRRCGEPFAIGHAPTAGFDTHGLTALLNSVAKVDPANGGATTNIKLSRDWFADGGEQLQSMFQVYFARGGLQANITAIDRGDLEAALQTPEKYPHVLVRLGGWSARFIDLEPAVQQEILRRTLY